MSWDTEDATDRMPVPQQPLEYHTHHHVHHRGDAIWFAAVVFLVFALAAGVTLTATFSLAASVDRLLTLPVCRDVK